MGPGVTHPTLCVTLWPSGDVLCVWVWFMGLSHSSWTGKATRISWAEDETSIHEISVEGVQDFLLVAEPSSSLILAEVQILQCCWAIWARESKYFEEVRLWYWNPWGATYFGGFVSFSTALNYLVWQLRTLKYLEWVLLSDYSESLMNQLEFCLVEILSEL